MTILTATMANQKPPAWLVLGYDGFEACSDPETSDPWYEIGRFASEQAALACAWKRLRRWKPGQLEDAVHIRAPDGTCRRCVIRYCRDCHAPDALVPTGRTRRSGPSGLFRPMSWEYTCKLCGRRAWRDRDQVFLIGDLEPDEEG